MSTQAPTQMPAAPMMMEAELPPAMQKALDQTMQGLGKMYMEAHKMSPDSAVAGAIMSLQQAVAEVSKNLALGDDPGAEAPPEAMAEEDPMAGAEDPMAAEDPSMGAVPEAMPEDEGTPPGYSMDDAAADTHSMTMEDAAKRRLGQ